MWNIYHQNLDGCSLTGRYRHCAICAINKKTRIYKCPTSEHGHRLRRRCMHYIKKIWFVLFFNLEEGFFCSIIIKIGLIMNILLIFPGFIIAFIIVLYYECKIIRTEPRNMGSLLLRSSKAQSLHSKTNGIIPLIYKRIICTLWKGHNYIPVSPEDLSGKRLFECKYCKKQHVW